MSSAARLRTKNGCMTCRQRRVKCTERRPVCHNCKKKGRQCLWVAGDAIPDKRFRQSRKSPSPQDLSKSLPLVRAGSWEELAAFDALNGLDSLDSLDMPDSLGDDGIDVFTDVGSHSSSNLLDNLDDLDSLHSWNSLDVLDHPTTTVSGAGGRINLDKAPNHHRLWSEFFVRSNMLTAPLARSNMEGDLFRALLEAQQSWLVLPGAHPGFNHILIGKLVEHSAYFEGLKAILVANGASCLYSSTRHPSFYEISLTYYATGVSQVSSALSNTEHRSARLDDALLLSIMYLYIHGVSPAVSLYNFETSLCQS